MASSNPLQWGVFYPLIASLLCCSFCVQAQAQMGEDRRLLLSFREKNGNATFDCSPSGPCVACLYSEKNEEKYRCSETGYRIPLKCVEIEEGPKKVNRKKFQERGSALESDASFVPRKVYPELQGINKFASSIRRLKWRSLLDVSFTLEGGKQSYITFRSCVPATNDEKLTVLGFEVIMMCLLLVTFPIIYLRRKHSFNMSGGGAVRIPTNSRF